MADQDPNTVVKEPVQADPNKGIRFPEDELGEIERKAAEEAKLKAEGGTSGSDEGGAGDGVDDDASVTKLSDFMKKKGINDVGRLVDLTAELESKNTKQAQEIARLSAVQRYPAGQGVSQPGGPTGRAVVTVDDDIEIPENPFELVTNKETLKKFAKGLLQKGRELQARDEQERTFGSVQARVQQKLEANPDEFRRLRPTMLELSRENPGADIDQLYDAAKIQYSSERKSLVAEIRAELGLTGNETERLKGIVNRVRQAPISGGTGVQIDPKIKSAEKEGADLLKAIANADKY